MSDNEAKQVPLLELLRSIPRDARMIYNHPDGSGNNIPVGKYAAESVAEIERLTAELAAAEAEYAKIRIEVIEECARVCDVIASECADRSEDYSPPNANSFVKGCAKDIRALSTKGKPNDR